MFDKIIKLALILNIIVTGYLSYSIYQIRHQLDDAILVSNQANTIAVNLNGKLQEVSDKTNTLMNQKVTNTVTQEIRYIEKESSNDADVELKTNPAQVSVKVNGGEKYYLNTLPTETSKFEDGKLVINQAYSANLDIRADEYKHSKWSLITAMNSDKDVIGGLNYELGHTVSATILAGQGIKPYYGLTWRIGGHN